MYVKSSAFCRCSTIGSCESFVMIMLSVRVRPSAQINRLRKKYKNEAKQRYEEHHVRAGYRMSNIEDEHLYLCYKCMEEGLGRKIRHSDLIGKNMPLNEEFEYMYF